MSNFWMLTVDQCPERHLAGQGLVLQDFCRAGLGTLAHIFFFTFLSFPCSVICLQYILRRFLPVPQDCEQTFQAPGTHLKLKSVY